ncbi:DNA-directed RNA polymerase III subunit RPC4-like [Cynara cardunculus var. scolymus]|uniref:DNA-directed RNA polymerase III subunit RPC4-like n=1 Tax=Cynara cardunculus var. scolymus TaxID=59895 RepID=UPI000D62EE1B|nr:DNA-directed RNA polymerase III subunit RPC4-like [Cynara cardunculus var. scolymus]XP_024980486.1 DNA-directed RNA polymerase III subunit RPC4-like [Cynara cardunculus var. scolymus]
MDKKNDNGDPKPQRKMKFMPKKPPRREQKLVLPKPEKVEDAETEEVKAQELLKRFNEASKKPKFKTETKPSKTRVSSFSFGSTPKSGGDAAATPGITMKEYKEPWDYYKNYPVTLPVRMPYSGNPELLDEQEFKVDSETNAYDESSVKAAEELGLMEEDLEKKLIFIQLPTSMPLPKQAAKTEGGEAATSSKPSKPTGPGPKACSLKELPSGFMGKMLVYKSGAVKLKLGDHLYNVDGGVNCSFAQDVVVINTDEKHCCNVGELNKRAIITPDIDSVLDNMEF